MDFTIEISNAFNISPFEVLDQDKDHVIMMINYYVEKGEQGETPAPDAKRPARVRNTNGRVRVNDRTATGGWF